LIPYLITWVLLAVNALSGARRWSATTDVVLLVAGALLIGLRDQVGGDWFNYLPYVLKEVGAPFLEIAQQDEPGYALLNWIGANWGGGIYLVNTICALIFGFGLVRFCRAQPRPWLALTLAFPYLVVVVAMGYTRQSVAIGLECLALLALERDRLFTFLGWIVVAASFHKTALVLMLLPASALSSNLRFGQLIRLALLGLTGYGLFNAVLAPSLESYQYGYLEAEYQSQGALIRVLLCLLPAVAFLMARRRFGLNTLELWIWTILSLAAVLAAVGLATIASSTAVDRLALYLIPLQLFVGSRLPGTGLFRIGPAGWNLLLVALSLVVLLVWLLFAGNRFSWLPYQNLFWSF
jgi:hypothetical protein